MVTTDIWRAIKLLDMGTDHGIWPVAGGSLDQSSSFMRFSTFWQRIIAKIQRDKLNDQK